MRDAQVAGGGHRGGAFALDPTTPGLAPGAALEVAPSRLESRNLASGEDGRVPEPCPDDAQLLALCEQAMLAEGVAADGGGAGRPAHAWLLALPDAAAVALRAHLDVCERCRQTVALAIGLDAELHVRATMGRYELLSLLGAGGMGMVWKAYDPHLQRYVAVKVLRAESVAGRQRLLVEARALARLNHPNVVAVHDVGEDQGMVFIATEFVDGAAFDQWQREQPIDRIVDAYLQAAAGLAAAHALGVVHRDVKPHNLLMGNDGRVRVVDFGLASEAKTEPVCVGALPHITAHGQTVGTPAYMAPEQRRGSRVDARADQYAWAYSFVAALNGRLSLAGPSGLSFRDGAVLDGAPPTDVAPAEWLRALPRELTPYAPLLQRALAIDPAERFASMPAVVEAWAAIAARTGSDANADARALRAALAARRDVVVDAVKGPKSGRREMLQRSPRRSALLQGGRWRGAVWTVLISGGVVSVALQLGDSQIQQVKLGGAPGELDGAPGELDGAAIRAADAAHVVPSVMTSAAGETRTARDKTPPTTIKDAVGAVSAVAPGMANASRDAIGAALTNVDEVSHSSVRRASRPATPIGAANAPSARSMPDSPSFPRPSVASADSIEGLGSAVPFSAPAPGVAAGSSVNPGTGFAGATTAPATPARIITGSASSERSLQAATAAAKSGDGQACLAALNEIHEHGFREQTRLHLRGTCTMLAGDCESGRRIFATVLPVAGVDVMATLTCPLPADPAQRVEWLAKRIWSHAVRPTQYQATASDLARLAAQPALSVRTQTQLEAVTNELLRQMHDCQVIAPWLQRFSAAGLRTENPGWCQ